ncbi:MAG: hypothetical protein Q4A74_04225 [Cardiobacteriaceae bacterium]|nr:hypothetical protein [Cardiobacteriaceae bacterium]
MQRSNPLLLAISRSAERRIFTASHVATILLDALLSPTHIFIPHGKAATRIHESI